VSKKGHNKTLPYTRRGKKKLAYKRMGREKTLAYIRMRQKMFPTQGDKILAYTRRRMKTLCLHKNKGKKHLTTQD